VTNSVGMRRITGFRLTTDRIYDGGPIRIYYTGVLIRKQATVTEDFQFHIPYL